MKRTDEYILSAANWYKDLPLVKDDFPKGFIRPLNCDRGMVFCGLRHHICLYIMVAMTGKMQHQAGEEIQGFITSKNRFVNRLEALEIARTAGQINENELGNPLIGLFSEDLY
jgi:hypothetical protein